MFRTVAMVAIASLAFTSCIKHNPYNHRPGPGPDNGGGTEEKLLLTHRSDWTATYLGRDKSSGNAQEHFRLRCNGAWKVFPLIISPDDLKNVYGDDLLAFFEYEVGLLKKDAQADPSTPLDELGVYQAVLNSDVWFNRHMFGTWILYLPELDDNLDLTGKYGELTFTIAKETPTEEYKRMIGNYRIYDLEGHGSFEIMVSEADPNYLYYVDGWETGRSVHQQMDGNRDWIYARFADGKLVFYAQFLQVEDYDNIQVDEVFAGTILSSTSDLIGDLDWQGVDFEDPIAQMVYDGNAYRVIPTTVHYDNGYEAPYNSMRYSRLWFSDGGQTVNWAFYNESGVPALPAGVEVLPGTRSTVSAPAVRTRTRATVHRDQLKPVRTSRPRKAAKNG